MHIKAYLNEFSSIQSKEKRKVESIFDNLNKSRKSLSKLYDQQKINLDRSQSGAKIKKYKNNQLEFQDNFFTELRKHNLQIFEQGSRKISNKPDIQKMSFKLNYVQNHRPIIKQSILKKIKEDSHDVNFITEPKMKTRLSEKSKIEKFIEKQKDKSKQIRFRNNSQNRQQRRRHSVQDNSQIMRQKHYKYQKKEEEQNRTYFERQNLQHKTLPVRKIKSSLQNYCMKQELNKNLSLHSRYKQQEKTQFNIRQEVPEYVKNIMKPCRIQGIELSSRLFTSRKKNFTIETKFLLSRKNTIKKNNNQKQDKNFDQLRQQWKMRMVKTARENNRDKITRAKQNSINGQSLAKVSKKAQDFQPWHNQDENDHQITLD